MSEMINRFEPETWGLLCSSHQASGTDVQEWAWSGYLENSREERTVGCGGGRGCVASRACGHPDYWKSISSLSVDEVQKGVKRKRWISFFLCRKSEICVQCVCVCEQVFDMVDECYRETEGTLCVCVSGSKQVCVLIKRKGEWERTEMEQKSSVWVQRERKALFSSCLQTASCTGNEQKPWLNQLELTPALCFSVPTHTQTERKREFRSFSSPDDFLQTCLLPQTIPLLPMLHHFLSFSGSLQHCLTNKLYVIKRKKRLNTSTAKKKKKSKHSCSLVSCPHWAFLSWRLSKISNNVLRRRQEILEKSNNVMTILITFTVEAQLHICTSSDTSWPRRKETIFTPDSKQMLSLCQ